MRWQNERESENVEDRRGVSAGQMAVGGGLGTIFIVLVASLLTGSRSPGLAPAVRGPAGRPPAGQQGAPVEASPEEQRQAALAKTTLAMTEDVWTEVFAKAGKQYQQPRLVLFRDTVDTEGCGGRAPRSGPSTARRTRSCTSTWPSTRSSRSGSRPPANSPRPT